MGVDSTLFSSARNNDKLRSQFNINSPFLLYAGRLSEKKGVKYLLEAMQQIIKQTPEAKLLIVGTGEEKKNLQQLSEKLGLKGHVTFTGALPNKDLPDYFASADIFIGPSIKVAGGDTEGFGLTFVEAGMSGCIVIGTDVGGISDIIQHGETGFLVKEKSPEQIATTVNMILEKKVEWDHIKENARNSLCSKFDWSVIAEQYIRILAEICL
jgi:glycosyltransferase involved in cell wall biosynthesis